MNLSTTILVLLAFVLICSPASANGRGRGRSCYVRSQRCCYVHKPCGVQVRREKKHYPCPHKTCKNVCTKKCRQVRVKEEHNSCRSKRVRTGQKCYREGHRRVCKPRFGSRRVCATHYTHVRKPRCNRVCHKQCRNVHATCDKIEIYHYPRLCAEAQCGHFSISGRSKAPADKIGDAKLVKTIREPRRRRH